MSLAQTWLARLPTGGHGDASQIEHLTSDLYAEIREDQDLRDACAALLQLDAIILARALEHLDPDQPGERAVRAASALLTVLHSTDSLSASAPGFIDPFTTLATCEALAAADFEDRWTPPHESIVPATRAIDHAWEPPTDVTDLVTNTPMEWEEDGVVAILGLRQAAGIEQALRAAPDAHSLSLVLVTDDPAERTPLARFVLSEVLEALRSSVPSEALTGLSVALDRDGTIARAAGLRTATDDTHIALRVEEPPSHRASRRPSRLPRRLGSAPSAHPRLGTGTTRSNLTPQPDYSASSPSLDARMPRLGRGAHLPARTTLREAGRREGRGAVVPRQRCCRAPVCRGQPLPRGRVLPGRG